MERSVSEDHIEDVSDFALAFEDFGGQEDGGRDHDLHLIVMGVWAAEEVEVVHRGLYARASQAQKGADLFDES